MTPPSRTGQGIHIDEAAATFSYERDLDAPRELVFEAWSTCEHLRRWFGPAGWTLPVCELDFRPGGRWRYGMQGPDGTMSHGLMVYGAIEPPARIEYTDYFTDEHGTIDHAMPVSTTVLELHDLGEGRTRLASTTQYASPADLRTVLGFGAEAGLVETLDRLAEHLLSHQAREGSTTS